MMIHYTNQLLFHTQIHRYKGRRMINEEDKELLTFAAKAGVVKVEYLSDWDAFHYTSKEPVGTRSWNPLTDDGDALRLAVTLGMRIETPKYKGFGTTVGNQTVFRDDPFEQTRRAIVLYAASTVHKGGAI